MELFQPDSLELNASVVELMNDAEQAAERVNVFRPLPPDVIERIQRDLLGPRVHASNAIEGNTLDLRETVTVLTTGQLLPGRQRESLEARNLGRAIETISKSVSLGREAHTVERLLGIHRILLEEIDETWAGRFRDHRVMIHGAKYQPPHENQVPALMERFLEILRSELTVRPIVLAAWAHWAIARIHPFHDGNGRTARLWQDLVLFQRRMTSAIIRPEDRREYLDSLAQADEGDFNSLVMLLAARVLRTFDLYDREVREVGELESFVGEIVGEVDQRAAEHRLAMYERWSRWMSNLREQFDLVASKITNASQNLRVHLRKYDLIDENRWDSIRSGLGAEKTWFFTLTFELNVRKRRYYFFFEKHYNNHNLDTPEDLAESRVSLSVSEDDGSGTGVKLDQIARCPVSIREVFVSGDQYVARRGRWDDSELQMSYDRGVSALRLAQDFIRDVVQWRLR